MLSLSNVTYTYPNSSTSAVKNANCEFEEGTLYAIVGPSGSGKSTLLSMLAGLDQPTEGEVAFDGVNISMYTDSYRLDKIAMIFQAFQLFSLLTVIENVCYPLDLCEVPRHEARARAKKLLERVGITPEKFKRYPSRLSGGEQQRVAIARSLSAGAMTLLADEPTGNLDVANTGNIMEILQNLAHNDGYCVIVVTHDQEVADAADVVYNMRDGVMKRMK